ncbi:Nitroreductase family protein [Candidatus Nitrosotenuis uzonensis]|uniref:Nitroreductase family protein n=1 Tax=Candidatus Nitrosotenuis uzonensis TaxID=1407055 RepID=V6AV45_9ARCH|nr:Nitroreductase family protein [Candidatus Nitrosotenuis uzonensis]
MYEFAKVDYPYVKKDNGCRLVWTDPHDNDKEKVIYLTQDDLSHLHTVLSQKSTGRVTLEDNAGSIIVNESESSFNIKGDKPLTVKTSVLAEKFLKFIEDHDKVIIKCTEYVPSQKIGEVDVKNKLLSAILTSETKEDKLDTDLFHVMATRRSTRKFAEKQIEDWKIDRVLAAADTAPTAGNFQGFEVFYVKDEKVKEMLVKAANNQPYVNAPLVLVFCKNPSRVKLNFPPETLAKFAIQDATIACAYSQLAASALGLSSIWIGMIDEQKVMDAIGTNLRPSSILCIGYPVQKRNPRPRRNLKDLIHVI